MKWISSAAYLGFALTFTISSVGHANVGGPIKNGTLLTRPEVERLIQRGPLTASQIVEVEPEAFVKLHRFATASKNVRVAELSGLLMIGGPSVIVCTISFCMAMARDLTRANHPPHDPSVDIAAPAGGW